MSGLPWTLQEVEILRAGYAAGTPLAEIGRRVGRSKCAVTAKAFTLRLEHPNKDNPIAFAQQKGAQVDAEQNTSKATSAFLTAARDPQNGFTGHIEKQPAPKKPLSLLARQDAAANAALAKRGEGDRGEIEQTHWTLDQQTALATGLKRGSSVEEIARAVGKSIPETYAKIHEKQIRRAA